MKRLHRGYRCHATGGYGDLWAGADATYALATLSLAKEDANRRVVAFEIGFGRLDWTMEQFSEEQLRALSAWPERSIEGIGEVQGWAVHSTVTARKSYFDQKYPVVGVLKEYEGEKLRESDRCLSFVQDAEPLSTDVDPF